MDFTGARNRSPVRGPRDMRGRGELHQQMRRHVRGLNQLVEGMRRAREEVQRAHAEEEKRAAKVRLDALETKVQSLEQENLYLRLAEELRGARGDNGQCDARPVAAGARHPLFQRCQYRSGLPQRDRRA